MPGKSRNRNLYKGVNLLYTWMGKTNKPIKIGSEHITTRIRRDLFLCLNEYLTLSGLDLRTIFELSLSEFLVKSGYKLSYDGIDLREISELIRLELKRKIQGIERNEFLSRELFISRMRTDIYKLVLTHKRQKTPLEEIIKTVSDYIVIRKKEAIHYKDKDTLNKCIEIYEKELKTNDLDRLLRKIEDEASIVNVTKLIEKGEK